MTDLQELDLLLEGDPARVYAGMDEPTRERYRRACEALADAEHPAATVAREAVRLAAAHEPPDSRGRHVGTWLLAEGRERLEAVLGLRVPWRTRVLRFVRRHIEGVYVGGLLVLTALLLVGMERLLAGWGLAPLPRWPLLLLLAPSVLDLVEETTNALLAHGLPELEPLPRLDPARVFTPQTRTLVVTPLLVTSAEDITAQLRMLEINYLGNVEPELYFALLTDFRDAPQKDMPLDGELRERLERGLRELNERHGYGEQPRFLCLHRERRWNPVAGRWMGWERKRGKLDELNRLVLGAEDTSYTGPVPALVRTVRYVLTLDADTHLLPGDAARLVATLHHPLNRARLDASGRRVVAGYSMLQPVIANGPSRELWLASGGWSFSLLREKRHLRRSRALGTVSQWLFGTTNFTGKGLYDVAAFTRALEGRIPENAILSHDKLEGMYARIALTTDIRLFESASSSAMSQARIWHRWTRGDWQVLPWLLPWVPAQDGRLVPNTLSLIDRWTLLGSLRASLVWPLSLLLFTSGWLLLPSHQVGAWTLGLVVWNRRAQLAAAGANLVRTAMGDMPLSLRLRSMLLQLPRLLIWSVFNMAILLPATGLLLDAMGRALYGLAFDRSRMLEWTTHAQTKREVRGVFALFVLPEVWGATVLTLAIGGALAAFNPGALPWASPLLLAWLPMLVLGARQRPPSDGAPARPPEALARTRELARPSWELYARRAPGALPPPGEAREGGETLSPTDLALGLVAPLSAYHLGYLDLEALVSRLDASLATVEGLERHQGHPFARYDAHTGRPVAPRRIRTAESGVWAAALLVVERGVWAARTAAEAGSRERLAGVEARVRRLREALDFAWLYDAGTGLLHTGQDVEAGVLEDSRHGLLSSGAMLAGFVAIAQRQVPLRHWEALAASDQRLRAQGATGVEHDALAEHLLPSLFLWIPPSTLLGQAAYEALEVGRRAPAAPPLSVLSLRFQPERAVAELQRVVRDGDGAPRVHGMALAAVANLTCDDVLVRHFHQHWQTAWVEALVYETRDTP